MNTPLLIYMKTGLSSSPSAVKHPQKYRQIFNTSRTLVGNIIAGAAPTTSSFST